MDSKKVAKKFVEAGYLGLELLSERLMSLTPEEERRINLKLVAEQIKMSQRIKDELKERSE